VTSVGPVTNDLRKPGEAGGEPGADTRIPLAIFAWSRLAIWGAIVCVWLLSESYENALSKTHDLTHRDGFVLDSLARWDSGWLLAIADKGYSVAHDSYAFFPLYPLLVGVLGRALLHHYLLAAVILSLGCGAAAFVLFYRLVARLEGREVAARSVLFLALFPTSLYLGVAYTESLYLLLTIAAFVLAERRQWLGAGAMSGLAILTRSSGVALLFALPLLARRSTNRARALAELAIALPIAALYPGYLWIRTGHPFIFMSVQREGWGRRVPVTGPLAGIGRGLDAGFQGVRQLIAGPNATHTYWAWATDTTVPRAAMLSVLNALALIVFGWLAVVAWRRLGAAYGVFSIVSLLIPLAAPTHKWPLLSLPRFGVTIFPLFIALALVAHSKRASRAVVWTSVVLAAVVIEQWATYFFIA
jgi:hypothetical protein